MVNNPNADNETPAIKLAVAEKHIALDSSLDLRARDIFCHLNPDD
jgi:hypothetical protein